MIPNHVLVFGAAHSGKLRVCETLLGESVSDVDGESHSGIIVKFRIKNKYYSHDLSLFVDEFGSRDDTTDAAERLASLSEWKQEFQSEECKELRDTLDGLVFTVDVTDSPEFIGLFIEFGAELKEGLDVEYDDWLGFVVFVGVSSAPSSYETVEDQVISKGLEFLYLNEEGINEFKEKIGKDRLREIFDTHEWKTIDPDTSNYEERKVDKSKDMTQSLLSAEDNEEPDAADFTHLLRRLRLAKEEANTMTGEERKKYAQQVLDEVIDYI